MEDREPSVRARHIGRALANAMQTKRFTAQEIAAELGWSPSRVSRALTGKRGLRPIDLAALLALCGITGPPRNRLLTLAEQVLTESPWCEDHGKYLPADLPALCELEDIAASLTCVDMVTVPALGQAEGYHRVLLGATPIIPDADVTERVIAHRTRQRRVLNRRNPPTIRIFLTEQALTGPGVAGAVLCDQVHHLLRLAVRPRFEIRGIPAGCTISSVCPSFQFMTFPDGRPVVYLEQLTSTTFLDHPTTVASYETLLAKIGSTALNPELSRSKLATTAAALSEPPGHPDAPETAFDDWLGQLPTAEGRETDEQESQPHTS